MPRLTQYRPQPFCFPEAASSRIASQRRGGVQRSCRQRLFAFEDVSSGRPIWPIHLADPLARRVMRPVAVGIQGPSTSADVALGGADRGEGNGRRVSAPREAQRR